MNRTPKYVGEWDKDKSDTKNYIHSYRGNYTDSEENMENFNFKRWMKSIILNGSI